MRMNSAKPRGWGGMARTSVLIVLVAVLGLFLGQGGARALEPLSGEFEPVVSIGLTDDHSDVNADLTTTFEVPEGDYNYRMFVSFTPVEFFPEEDVPIGAWVGELSALATLGLMNGPCTNALPPNFKLYWASTDTSDTCTFEEQFAGDFLTNSAYAWQPGIECYPDFATRIVPGTPIQRMFGATVVAGSEVSINFIIFEAGALAGYPAAWGRPSVTLLNDLGDPAGEPTPDPISDFCAPLSTDIITFGLSRDNPDSGDDEAGYEVRRNPAYGGTYTFRWSGAGNYDADGDGIENGIDTCPYDPNVGDYRRPHTSGGGDDVSGDACDVAKGEATGYSDGIDCACDPDPTLPALPFATKLCWPGSPSGTAPAGTALDCDADGYQNRLDNCPLVANGEDEDNQADGDSDSIGDACDDNPDSPDGESIAWSEEQDVEISGPEPGEDSDGDGSDDVTEAELGSCPKDPCSDWFCSGIEAAESTPEHESVVGTCTDDLDNDKDGYIDDYDGGCAEDTDEDGVSDDGEDELGSDPDDADSTPEDASICDVCTDGLDNDGDGETDAADEGCAAAAATPTPTPAPGEGTPTPTPEVTATPTVAIEVEFCPPVIPGTYYGLVRMDGKPAADGYELTASIGGTQWADTIISGGRYAMDIPDHLPAQEPCFEGGTITFELNGMTCTPVEEGADQFAAGLQNVDLNCALPATPVATPPPAAPTPAATATPAPATPTATPAKPPVTGGGGLADPSQGLPVWAMALAGCVGLMTVAGLGTLVATKRR